MMADIALLLAKMKIDQWKSRSEIGLSVSSFSKTKGLTNEWANSWTIVGMTHQPVNRGTPVNREGELAPITETNSWEPSGRIRLNP